MLKNIGKWFGIAALGLLFAIIQGASWGAPGDEDYPLEEAPLLTKTISYVQTHYVDPSRINPDAMFEASLNQIQRTIPEVLSKCEKPSYCQVTVRQATKRFPFPAGELKNLKSTLREVLQFLALHVGEETDKKEIEYAAIDGLLNELDPHSAFMNPESYREFEVGTEGEFGGLGIVINLKDGHLTVMSPLEGTPAWKAGVKAGDRIVQIDEESTVNMSLTEAVGRLRGPVGTKVTLKLERLGINSSLSVLLSRAIINIEAVQSKLLKTPNGNNVGFIRVKSFQANTEPEFHEQLMQLASKENHIHGLILDLRNNPGGLMDQAINLADEFLKEGTIVSTVGRGGKLIKRDKAHEDGTEGDWPMIVLVNEGSASASEILAGALKNNNRALVLGHRTFGKGSVQSIYRLPFEAAVKLTVAQYLTPGNQSIQSVGIPPDIELIPMIVDKAHLDTVENIFLTEKDLEKHFAGDQTGSQDLQPSFTLRYLSVAPQKEELSEYSNSLKLEEDITADVALNLMDVFAQTDRVTMLKEAAHFLQARQIIEDEKMAENFKTLKIDWGIGSAKGKPQGELSFYLVKDGRRIQKIPAGESVTLELTLKNIGNAPFYRLVGQTSSDQFNFQNIEFAFGKVAPKESKTWETKLTIPKPAFSEEVPLKLNFQEANHNAPPEVQLFVPIQELKRPRFAHQYSLEEGWKEKLENGKSIDMQVAVTNQGEGAAQNAVVSLRNLGGKETFIEKGRIPLKPMLPGQTETSALRFHIDPAWEGEEIRLEISVVDADLMVGTKQNITLRLNEGVVDPPVKTLFSPPAIFLATQGGTVSVTPFLLKGEAKDDQAVKDLSIFVDEQKAFYEANPREEGNYSFNTSLPLKKGNNTIMVTARDNWNLLSREFIVIRYDPALPKPALPKKKMAHVEEGTP